MMVLNNQTASSFSKTQKQAYGFSKTKGVYDKYIGKIEYRQADNDCEKKLELWVISAVTTGCY